MTSTGMNGTSSNGNTLNKRHSATKGSTDLLTKLPTITLLLILLVVGIVTYLDTKAFFACVSTTTSTASTATTTTAATTAASTTQSYELAKYESYNFFTDIDDTTWIRHQQRARYEPMYFNQNNPAANSAPHIIARWLLMNVDPMFTCPNLRRVGGRGDGPKWTCDPHRLVEYDDCLIYSIGSRGIYKFEDGIVNTLKSNDPRYDKTSPETYLPNCEIHVFDPSPNYGRSNELNQLQNIHYHATGLKSSYLPFEYGPFPRSYIFKSIQDIMQQLNHTNRRIDIFKIDCEGCEFKTYKDWLDPSIDIRQVLVETHSLQVTPVHAFFERFFDMGFVPFSKEANTHPAAKPTGELFEWGFIKLHPNFLRRSTNLFNVTFV